MKEKLHLSQGITPINAGGLMKSNQHKTLIMTLTTIQITLPTAILSTQNDTNTTQLSMPKSKSKHKNKF